MRYSPSASTRGTSSDASLTELEDDLLKAVEALSVACGRKVETYVRNVELFARAEECASKLEKTRSGFGASSPRLITSMPGTWTLVLTNSKAVIKNAGSITGLGALPGAKCTKVQVVLEPNGKARTEETVAVLNGLISGENTLLGKWKLTGKSGRTLEVTYADAVLMGRTKLRADSKAVLETTYCGEKLRLGRNSKGDVFVFERTA